jgi:hypothetical protein
MPDNFYLNKLYPLQDEVLNLLTKPEVDFYLTGGTALSRYYLQHRYSDDLDFFVNDHPEFKKQCNTVISLFKQFTYKSEITTTSDSFVRMMLTKDKIVLKIDLVNDVSAHFGDFINCRIFNRIDSWQNILSNKICAMSRREVKDVVDMLFVAQKYAFNWEEIFIQAREKDLWVEPIEICRILNEFPTNLINKIKWIYKIDVAVIEQNLKIIHNDIFYGNINTLFKDRKEKGTINHSQFTI